jgi:large subunit ribosomal protein L23
MYVNKESNKESLIDLIKYPILTEKTIRLLEQNQYSFAVAKKANKVEIKNAVEQLFDVRVIAVNTSCQPLKKRRVGKYIGQKSQHKRAIVKLAAENSITFFEDV